MFMRETEKEKAEFTYFLLLLLSTRLLLIYNRIRGTWHPDLFLPLVFIKCLKWINITSNSLQQFSNHN